MNNKRKILITGASGFIGKNILPILESTYEVFSLGNTDSDDYNIDITDENIQVDEKFDIVLHLAGLAHRYPKNKQEENEFYKVNYIGTKNLCNALSKCGLPDSFIFLSTVAVYGVNQGVDITEEYPLLGDSPYAKSKIMAEKYLESWCTSNNVTLSILRPALIAGYNPPGNLNSIINAIKKGRYFRVNNNIAQKSILMVEDIANIVCKVESIGGTYNLSSSTDPYFRDIEDLISKQLERKIWINMPMKLALYIAKIGDLFGNLSPYNTKTFIKITSSLTFSSIKAQKTLNWKPLDVLSNFTIKRTL